MSNHRPAILELELQKADCRHRILRQAAGPMSSVKTPRLESSTLWMVVAVAASLALFFLPTPRVHAQASPPTSTAPNTIGFGGYRRASSESLYAAARPPELTYTNSVYGLAFRFPSNFTLHLGNYGRGVFSSHSDQGEILLVTNMIPSGFWMGTNAAVMSLLVGVNPGISMESCTALVAPDEWTSGAALNLTIDGLEFKGRNEIEKSTGRGMQFGVENIYQRQYTGYSHGVCYEFEIDMVTADQSRMRMTGGLVQVDLDRVFAELEAIILTAKIEGPNPGALAAGAKREHITKPWETPLRFPKELAGMEELADWDIQYPAGVQPERFPYKICGIGESSRHMPITFGYGSSLDDAAANAAVDKLSAGVTRLIQKNGWKLSAVPGGMQSGTPNCYARDSVFVELTKGTSRCTMNSPCSVHDELVVTVYITTVE